MGSSRSPESRGPRPDANRRAGTGPGLVTVMSGVPNPSAKGAIDGRRREALIFLCASSASLVGLIELAFARSGPAVVNLCVAAAQFSLLEVRRRFPRRSELLAHVCLAIALANIVTSASLDGSVLAPSVLYLTGIPLICGMLLGRRQALAWSAAAMLTVPVLHLVTRPGVPVPRSRLEHLLHLGVFVAAGVATALGIRRMSTSQVGALEQRERTIQRLLEELSSKNAELATARDSALAGSRAKSDFLAVMSHEMRTPLNAVLGLTELMLGTPLSEEQRDLAGTIKSSGGALLTVINDILDFSKIEAGRLELSSVPFDVVECAEDAMEILAGAAAEKGLDLSCHVAPELPARLEGDPVRVRQVLLNLVSNAVKFTASGSVRVSLGVEEDAASGEVTVHAGVQDTGIGIQRDQMVTLFQPFSQIDASRTRKAGGTGLGLAICRRLAEAMGGRAWAESTPGEGSTFHFTFRAGVVAPPPERPPESVRAVVITAREGTRRAVIEQLAALGVRAAGFATPAEAAAAGTSGAQVLVVGDAFDPAEVERALGDARPAGCVVLVRSASARVDAWRGRAPGTQLVPVPVRRAALARALRRVTGGVAGSTPPPPRPASVRPSAPPLRVLVAEDNQVNQLVMRSLLQRDGHHVAVVATGVEAVAEVGRAAYDLVLMDMQMPEMDGVTATRIIRGAPAPGRRPYILALTANATSEDRDACLAAGMDGFLTKPIVQEELDAVLASVPRTVES